MQVTSCLIHEFNDDGLPGYIDDEGDQMMGFYYQFVDGEDQPCGGLLGPYRYRADAERAAHRAFARRDF